MTIHDFNKTIEKAGNTALGVRKRKKSGSQNIPGTKFLTGST